MKYLLDTNAVAALMKGDAVALARLAALAPDEVGVPQPVLAEIAYGIARLPHSRRKQALAERFALIRAELGRAQWSDEVSDAFGTVKASLERDGKRIEDFDAAIAAHALATGATLVTADAKHMVRIAGLNIENWSGKPKG